MNVAQTDDRPENLTLLISGRGSNMTAVHNACQRGDINASVGRVIANNPDAAGLAYAAEQGIATDVVNHRDFANRTDFDQALAGIIDRDNPSLIILAGFMRRLTGDFTRRYESRLLNIHPSLLPRHQGLDTHQRAIDSGDSWHGCSVHFVTEELDGGPVIAQSKIAVERDDSACSLAERVLSREHTLYPKVIELCLSGAVQWRNGHVLYEGKTLVDPLLF